MPAQVPLWVWLIWSPQLLMSLQRGEGPHARALLVQIAQAFPQAIYYSLRTMVLCLREFAFKVVQVNIRIACIEHQIWKFSQACVFAFFWPLCII